MESINHFKSSLGEIDILLTYAKENESDIPKYQLFNKAAIVLLSTKFEVFLEEFIDEHSLRILNGHTNMTLPKPLKDEYATRASELILSEKKTATRDKYLQALVALYNDSEHEIGHISLIRPSLKFNYGKHGQKEIERMYKCHGLKEFIESSTVKSMLMMINSLTAIRNNVVHQDSTPTITYQTVNSHKDNLLAFADALENEIESNKNKYYNE